MKKKLLVALALMLCMAVCSCVLAACQDEAGTGTISLDQTSLNIALDGEPVTLVAVLSEGEGSFTWESSNPEVATVDGNGTVTPVSKGTATITVKCGKLEASCVVTVGDPLHTPVFQADSMGLGVVIALNKGETYQIIDTVTYNGTVVDVDIHYASSDETVATVSQTGVVTGIGTGNAEITVSGEYLGIKIEMIVTVAVQSDISFTAAVPQALALTKRVTGDCITLIEPDKQIESQTLSVKLLHAGKDISETSEIVWSIADGGDAIVRLSATAGDSVIVSAIAPGEATVVATTTIGGTKYTVVFGLTVEEGPYAVVHTDDGSAAGATHCDGICDVCGQKIKIVHSDKNGDCACDYCGAALHADANFDGICDNNAKHDLRIRLTEKNAGTPALFAKIVAENVDRYLILTENLDWSGEGSDNLFGDTYSEYTSVDAIASFSGVLDGQGHMITGFRLGHSGANGDSAIFLKNSGTIKNIGFRYVLVTANSGQTGLVLENAGTIQNVFVDVTANARSWATGTVAGISTGTIRNCIALVNEASTGTGGNFAGIVGAYRGGSITSCYAIGNGHTTTESAYTECFDMVEKPQYTHFKNNNALLAAVKALSANNGWAKHWTVSADGIAFGGTVVINPVCEHIDNGKTTGTTPCDGVCDLCGEATDVIHGDTNGDCACDYCGTVSHTDEDFNGICDNNAKHDLRVHLTEENAGTPALFAEIVAANADKYIILTESLDWSGEGTANLFGNTYAEYTEAQAIADFSGVLDGQGYMITGFRLGHSGEANDSAMFLTNSGTIKNIGFRFSLVTANSGHTGLVRDNTGTIENVFVDVTFDARSWATGTIAGISTGTIRNCIALVNEASTGIGGNLAGVVGAYRDGSITNCYAIGNGHTTTENAYTECFNGLDTPVYTHFAKNNALLAAATLPAGDGWASHWTVSSDGISFGEALVVKAICEHIDNGKTTGTTPCDGACDLCGEAVTIIHVDTNEDCVCDYCGRILHTDADSNGICDNNAEHDLRVVLNSENAGTPALFYQTVLDNAGKYLILTEDLDWTGLSTANYVVDTFAGILDGQGHSITGFTIGVGAVGEEYHSCLIGINNGTIKNLAVSYNLAQAGGNSGALITKNYGTVENLFVAASFDGYSWNTAAIVAYNYAAGTVKNCITTVSSTLADQPAKDRLGSVVGADYNGTIANCYAVNTENSIATPYVDTWGGGSYTGNAVYADGNALLTAVTALPSSDGWASYWIISDEGIAFGGKLVIKAICEHADNGSTAGSTPCDGVCDLCGEAVTAAHADANGDCVCDYCQANLHTDADFNGICDNNSSHDLRVHLNAENAGTPALFLETVTANAGKYIVLTEDLDWTGLSTANYAVSSFNGILDGQGYSITGFTIGVSAVGEEYYTCLIGVNNGTIKNIAFEYNLAAAAGESSALIAKNFGTVENLFVKASFASYSWTTAAIVATNDGTGTVKNCIASVSSTLADQPAKDRLGSIVGVDYNGTIVNCYAVNTANSVATPYTDTWGNGTYTGNAIYASDAALLAAVTALPAGDGWASYWTVSADGIAFNGNIVIAGQTVPSCQHEDAAPVDGKCDLCEEAVALPEGTYLVNSTNAATLANFVALLNADLDGTFYLTGDLDYSSSADNMTGVGDFAGILDGQGHTVKGIKIKYNSNHEYESNLFKSNSGTIRNIAFEHSIVAANGNFTGLIGTNTGTVQNVYAKVTMTADGCGRIYGNSSPLVAINDGAAAVIKNCIVDVTVDASVTTIPETYGVVASRNANGATVDKCYYKVTGTAMPGIAYPWSTTNNTAVLDPSVTALPAGDGWSDCWKVDETGIWFGETQVLAIAPACQQHEDTAYVDGKCDLCEEAVALPEGTYLVNSETAATVADFVELLNADLDGTFYLTGDLDYSSSADNMTGVGDFAGILDGQGHTVKGIKIKYNSNNDYASNLFKSNSGTIQNIALEYSIVAGNGNKNGLVGENSGTIQNVYAKATVTLVTQYQYNSAFVASNAGTVKNCIVDVTIDASVTSLYDGFGAIACLNNGNAVIDKCYYKATSSLAVTGIGYPWGGTNNTAVLDSSVTALPAGDGWSDCWKVDETGIWFDETLVMALTPARQASLRLYPLWTEKAISATSVRCRLRKPILVAM